MVERGRTRGVAAAPVARRAVIARRAVVATIAVVAIASAGCAASGGEGAPAAVPASESGSVVSLLGGSVEPPAATGRPERSTDDARVRALGPAPIANFRVVRPGLYRGGHPSAEGLDYLQRLGVKTIVDLEIEDLIEAFPWEISHEIARAKARGMTVVRFPMSAFERAESRRFDQAIEGALLALRRAPGDAVYVHCKHGQDRTGLVIGLERVEGEGWSPGDAYDEMLRFGFHPGLAGLDAYFRRRTSGDGASSD